MWIAEILDAVAPDEEAQALAWLWAAAADEDTAERILDDLPRFATVTASKIDSTCGGLVD